ncbi:MAG: Uncharacterized protein G01um10147_1166 [Microgenomates group bacterium Gr01-1014_7]|nr:MAG: Uncharacterized protein G01um10147_1166 [Microgenomates group bacterium Gr01-1014_7]
MRTNISLSLILALAIITGQLVRIPVGTNGRLILLDIVVAFLCLLGLFQSKFKLIKPPLFIKGATVFITVCCLSLIFTPLHLNFSQYLTAFLYIIRFSLYILFGWLLLSGALIPLRKNINEVLLFSGVGLAVLGLLQFIFLPDLRFLVPGGWDPHYFRTVSTFLDPNFAGAFFVLTLLLLLSLRRSNFGIIITYIALLTTFSRSSYLMFLVSGLTLAFLKKSRSLFFKTLILLCFLLVGFQIYTKLVSQPRNIDREKSASFRLNTWQQGWAMFQKSPFFGVGYNAYRYALKEFNLGDEQFIQTHGASANDSSLLFVAATSGIIGLLSYLFFLFTLIKEAWKQNFILASALSGLIVHSFFANSLFYPPILAWIMLSAVSPKK